MSERLRTRVVGGWCLVALLLFAMGNAWFDERTVSRGGALPVADLDATASTGAEGAGLAVDLAAETEWIGESIEGQWWECRFPRPVWLRGVLVDTGNDGRRALAPLPLRLRPGSGERSGFESGRYGMVFRSWHRYEWEPALAAGVRLRPFDGARTKTGQWTLRDVRFLVDEAREAENAADRERQPGRAIDARWREGLGPALAAVIWLCWLFSARRPSARDDRGRLAPR